MGTILDYFEHFSFGKKRNLEFVDGKPFYDLFDVVLGSQVARKLGYKIGDRLTLAHGIGKTSFSLHDDKPFKVLGYSPLPEPLSIKLFM